MRLALVLAALVQSFSAAPAAAQQIGYGFGLLVPLVAETPSYQSVIFVHNPATSPADLIFLYTGATTSATPGPMTCNTVKVAAGSVLKTSLTALCPGLQAGSNFGTLALDHNGYQVALYTRAQAPSGNGFSVEGMMDGASPLSIREVIGLVRHAAAPTYQSNCFIGNQELRAGSIVVMLADGAGQAIAAKLIDLQPGEFIRLLDVFASLGAPAGDYDNVRASFQSIVPAEGGSPVGLIASCTVQNSTTFDADFRVAKTHF